MVVSSLAKVDSVHKCYLNGDVRVHALSDVSISIDYREFLTVCGPSGSGKTTLLNILGALDSFDSGAIVIGGQDLKSMSKKQLALFRRHKIGFIFQTFNLFAVLTALENVEFTMKLQGINKHDCRERARRALEKVGLSGLEDRRPSQLSGGQQQRVAVARAIAPEPILVLADEPTANLDSKTSSELLDMMQELNKSVGVTFVFSTHDPMVMERASRMVRIKDGQIY